MRRPSSTHRAAAVGAAFLAFALVDLLLIDSPLVVAYAVAPLLMALVATPRATAVIGAGAVALAVTHGVIDGFDAARIARAIILAGVGVLAVFISAMRIHLEDEVERLEVLREVGDAMAQGTDPEDAVGHVLDILVPRVADGAAVDLSDHSGGRGRRVAERGTLPGADEQRRELAARGRRLGEMVLARREGHRFADADRKFADAVARRTAVALDSAQLIDRATRAERELAGILAGLPEAVVVHDRTLRTRYANQAAADLLGVPSPSALIDVAPGVIGGGFEIAREDGTPVELDDLPGRRIFAGDLRPEPLLSRSTEVVTGRERWMLTKATAVVDDLGEPLLAVNVIEDVTESKRRELAARLLARAGEVLGESLDLETLLSRVAVLAVPSLADWCGVDLPGADGFVHPAAVAHLDPDKVELGYELRRRYPTRMDAPQGAAPVLRGETPRLLVEDVEDAMLVEAAVDDEHLRLLRAVGLRHVLIVGMRVPGETLGAVSFVRGPGSRPFDAADVQLAEELARRAATAVLNARLYQAKAEVARTLQQGLLPRALPTVPGVAMEAYYAAAGAGNDVGGDFYDAYAIADGWLVVIGDVTGKGPEAASLTGTVRTAIESVATLTGRPDLALATLDSLLARRGDVALSSAVLVHLHPGPDGLPRARILSAGHPPPVLLRGGVATAVGDTGPLLGVFGSGEWPEVILPLRFGDVLVLRTDGVTDTVTADGRLGEERLLMGLTGVPAGDAHAAVARVRSVVAAHQVGPQRDDVAVLAVACVGAMTVADAEALQENSAGDAPVVERIALDGSPASVRFARHAVEERLTGVVPERISDDVRLLVSELASNAVRHGGGRPYDVELELRHDGVRIAVVDRGPGFTGPRPRETDQHAEGGYGLELVDRLASRWGIDRDNATRVWFELRML